MAFFLVAVVLQLVSLAAVSGSHHRHRTVEVGVGVVVDMESLLGEMTLTTLRMALTDFYEANPNYTTRVILHPRSSPNNDLLSSASAVLDLIKNVQVQAIIGPDTSMEAQFDKSLAEKARVPMISFFATSPFVSTAATQYFIQATQIDSTQVSAITSFVQAFGWRQVVLIYVNNEFGSGVVPALTDALQNVSTRIADRIVLSSSSNDDQIDVELYKLKSMDTRVFIVHMDPTLGVRLFSLAKKLGMMDRDYAWIVTTGIADLMNSLPQKEIRAMEGVIGVRNHFPSTPELDDFVSRWKRKIVRENLGVVDPRINAFHLWAYDAISALARAVEKVNAANFKFEKAISSSDVSITDLSTFGVSQAGPDLIRAIQDTRFRGFSGDFKLIDRKLEASALEIINVVGNGEKTIGFWTPQNGLTRKLHSGNSINSVSKGEHGSIIWPGDSQNPPKGWVVSPNGKKLRILVPVKNGFEEFVKVNWSSGSYPPKVTGYCIDIFDAVMASLPYPVHYEYIPFREPNASVDAPTSSYNELISEVYFQRFDAVVGDVTIIANRSLYIDYTLPYTESGVTMVAPIKEKNKKTAWVFLMPLSWDLWVTSLCFFVFIAFVIWVLEHRINPQFRGPLIYQAGTSLYYSFSTMVFAHSQSVLSNTTRFVVIIWVFLVLILTQCYTASLSSMLTIQQLQPTVTDVQELISTGKSVGYLEGSFVYEHLIQKGFQASNLMSYKSPQELDDLFTKGSGKGGIAAAFDEIPYINVFLATYCSKYVMVPPTYKTGGFGFVFPLGSPLVDEVSRRILNVTEGDLMPAIDRKWFDQRASCLSSLSTNFSSSSALGLDSFWGLFLIAGCVAACALIAFLVRFMYDHRQIWLRSDPDVTAWGRVKELATIFDQRNMDSHTFKMDEPRGTSVVGSSHNSRCPSSPCPSCFSNHTEVTSLEFSNQSISTSPSPEYFRRNEGLVVEIPP